MTELDAQNRKNAKLVEMLVDSVLKEYNTWKPQIYRVASLESGVIGRAQRDLFVKWMSNLNKRFGFNPETLFLGVNIMDRFLLAVKANSKYLCCIAVVSLYLAAKTMEENEVLPSMIELVQTSECGCSLSEISRMELCILDKLNWNLMAVTPLDFLHNYHALLATDWVGIMSGKKAPDEDVVLNLAVAKLSQCLSCSEFLQFSPSVLALAVLVHQLDKCKSKVALNVATQFGRLVEMDIQSLMMCREFVSLHSFSDQPWTCKYETMFYQMPNRLSVATKHHEDDDDFSEDIRHLYDDTPSQMIVVKRSSANIPCL